MCEQTMVAQANAQRAGEIVENDGHGNAGPGKKCRQHSKSRADVYERQNGRDGRLGPTFKTRLELRLQHLTVSIRETCEARV